MFSIFIIDDDALIRRSLEEFLREQGYYARGFSNGETALEQMEREQPDMVLLDLRLPGLDGLDVLSEIKTSSPDVIVIIITG